MPLPPMFLQNPFCSRCHVSGSSWDNAERCQTADLDENLGLRLPGQMFYSSFQVHVLSLQVLTNASSM